MHLIPTKGEATKKAASLAASLNRWAVSGFFETRGRPEAIAGAPVILTGFGAAIASIEWIASVVTHTIEPGEGWITTVEVETKE
jgi:phage protein D